MPTIDAAHGHLLIRIVYDGPALSGKTTSLKALADGVGRTLECPEERDGRTIYFDWLEYVGGLYEGRQISCQIVSVPGQHELAHRRKLLVQSADAVVCVLDTRHAELEHGLHWLSEVASYCRGEAPPIGVVLQANKRDAADATPRDELRLRVTQIAPIAIVESVATASDGIREAFVLAVRLALDRVRALSHEGLLPAAEPNERSADDLMRVMKEAEQHVAQPAAKASRMPSTPPEIARKASWDAPASTPSLALTEESPFVPDPHMPGGMIWPPVDGRTMLHEVAGLDIQPTRTARGDWWGSSAGWRFHSSPQALFEDHDQARAELIAWARLHAAAGDKISKGRVIVLAEAGADRVRLWQLVRVETALRERLESALSDAPAEAADELQEVAAQLLDAQAWFSSGALALPCTLWTVGAVRSRRPSFVGLMPRSMQALTEPEGLALLQRELAPQLRQLRRARVDYAQVRGVLLERARANTHDRALLLLAELLRAID